VFHTDAPVTGGFTSASGMVNQIWKNTMWGQRGNLESVPTDCPQRDERLGWMGDAGIFWRTATYNMDMQAFTHKWMNDVADAQSPEGGFSDVTPRVVDPSDGAPAWGDAGIILPWTAWLQYGDRRVIEENWTEMERWMGYIHDVNPDLIWNNRRNNDFGDWVPADSTTPKDLIATAYWAQDAKMMADMARAKVCARRRDDRQWQPDLLCAGAPHRTRSGAAAQGRRGSLGRGHPIARLAPVDRLSGHSPPDVRAE
jgi:alpha-L-rhamnosidase